MSHAAVLPGARHARRGSMALGACEARFARRACRLCAPRLLPLRASVLLSVRCAAVTPRVDDAGHFDIACAMSRYRLFHVAYVSFSASRVADDARHQR